MLRSARPFLLSILAMLASLAGMPCMAQAPALSPVQPGWQVIGDVAEGEDISGIACVKISAQVRRRPIAVDEKVSAILATIDGNAKTIKPDGELKLIEKVKGQELDAEAVAYDSTDNAFYVVGSHGRKRKCCKGRTRRPSTWSACPSTRRRGGIDPDDGGSGVAPPDGIAPPNILPAMRRSRRSKSAPMPASAPNPRGRRGRWRTASSSWPREPISRALPYSATRSSWAFAGPSMATPPTCWPSTARACSSRGLAAT